MTTIDDLINSVSQGSGDETMISAALAHLQQLPRSANVDESLVGAGTPAPLVAGD